MKRVFLALTICFLSFSSMAQLGGSIIYEPINRPPLPPIKLQQPTSIFDEYDRQNKQKLELEILREQKRSLQLQNNQIQNASETIVFKLENINYLTSALELTEWKILSAPHYAVFNPTTIKLNQGTKTKTFTIVDSKEEDKFIELQTVEGIKTVINPLEKGLFMIIFLEKNNGVAYVGTLSNIK